MKSTDTEYYVLPEGATQEKLLEWEAIEDMCRSGQFTPDTRIFLPAKNSWVRAGDSELKSLFKEAAETPAPECEGEDAERTALEAEYQEAVRRTADKTHEADAYVAAARLAAELGDRDAAREHFQKALGLKPFNPRIAQEVQRRFSKSECKEFLYLRRDPPPWDDPADIFTYPLTGGILYLAVPAVVIFALLLIPFGLYVAGPLVFLWGVQISRRSSAGSARPPLWHGVLANPVAEMVLPLLAGVAVAAESVLVVYGVGRLSMMLSGNEGSAFGYVAESPVLSVILAMIALAYLPAVFVRITHSVGIVVDLLSPWTVLRAAVRMEQEYVVSALFVLVLAAILGGLKFAVGGIPVLGKVLLAVTATYSIPAIGYVLGRLAGRMRHVL